MIFIGMIYQYNAEQGLGLIMLSDGEKKEFSSQEWVDTKHSPSVGQKIAYESNASVVKIRVATEDDISNRLLEESEKTSQKQEESLDIEEQINHFTAQGFKLIKDIIVNGSRTVILRSFRGGESEELIIKEENLKVTITQTINGKRVPLDK